jgi:FkbM family methyltransferase
MALETGKASGVVYSPPHVPLNLERLRQLCYDTDVTDDGTAPRHISTLQRLKNYLVELECFDQYFDDIEATLRGSTAVLDFSKPRSHCYRRHGVCLSFPGTPEDDSIAGYTYQYRPQPGDLVFDVGAHAGFTACMLAKIVGPQGKVIAFEPDRQTLAYLKRNIAELDLTNVTIVPKAMDATSKTAFFNADGTMGAGLVEDSVYANTGSQIEMETISLDDACRQFGIPQFIKMDIEGSEVRVIQASAELLKANPIHMAFDSYHRMPDGRYTYTLLESMFSAYGYSVLSSSEFGQMFTWANPPGV